MERINRIEEILRSQKKTKEWLTKNLDSPLQLIISICDNQSQPDLNLLKRIAEGLNVDIRELLVPTKGPQKQEKDLPATTRQQWNGISNNFLYLSPQAGILTKKEKELLYWIADGLSTKQISWKVQSSKNTIAQHRKNMLRNTNSKNVAELIRYAITNGILE